MSRSRIDEINELIAQLESLEQKRQTTMASLRNCQWISPGAHNGSGKLPDEEVIKKAIVYSNQYEQAQLLVSRADQSV